MEISCNKSKSIVNNIKPRSSTNKWMNGKALEEVDQSKCFGSTQTKDGTSIKEGNVETKSILYHVKASNTMEN